MTQFNLVQLAQTGDADAIAALMNTSLHAIGIRARATLLSGDLHVLLESEQVLDQHPCLEFIQKGITRLGMVWLSSAIVYSRVAGQNSPTWVQRIELLPQVLTNPFVLDPGAKLEAEEPFKLWLPDWHRATLFDLMLLTIPILVVLSSGHIWQRYLLQPPVGQRAVATKSVGISSEILSTSPEVKKASPLPGKATAAIRRQPEASHGMELKKVISGGISPKSIVYSGKDLFFVQNMMYNHTITVYDRSFERVKTISDQVRLADYGYPQFEGVHRGSPVEASATADGQHVWVSNYQMYGEGFTSSADDDCTPAQDHDRSFLYRINTSTLAVDQVVQVGAVPKWVATAPNRQLVLVSNWCSWDVSVVDTQKNQEVRRIQVGPYPRGIVIDPKSETAYVAIMGASNIAAINLKDFSVKWLRDVGRAPRHLTLDPTGRYLYATLSHEGRVVKIDLFTQQVIATVETGNAPRSMAMSTNGEFIYVVNYDSDTVSKVRTQDMQVVRTVSVDPAPIGITYDPKTRQVWVACYSGSILVFQD